MKMTTTIAFQNMKYNKAKNILTGIAIFLTSLLLFVIPTVGKDMIDTTYAVVNESYPIWHACYRDVDQETLKSLSVHNDIGTFGLRSDIGVVTVDDTHANGLSIAMIYLDDSGASLYKQALSEGTLPQKKNEIVVSEVLLEALDLQGDIGDTISLSYQIFRGDSLDYRQEGEFVIAGFLDDTGANAVSFIDTILVSEEFLKAEVPADDISYILLFQLAGVEHATTDNVEDTINQIAEQFSIPEDKVVVNSSYLNANYVDPAIMQIIIIVMFIVVIAGVITIYSIYYVAMAQRVQEFGRIKAIGATQKQIRQIVFREGMIVSFLAIPAGLIVGSLVTRIVLLLLVGLPDIDDMTKEMITGHKIPLFHGWIYLLVIVITLFTVAVSLLKPMRMAEKISVIDAMRYQDNTGSRRSGTRGYSDITIGRLAKKSIMGNKKKSLITIISMSLTGVFIMAVASVLSCTNADIMTDNDFNGQYMLEPNTMEGNKEHPEWEWSEVQKNNPLNDDLKAKIEALDGVERVDVFSKVDIIGGPFTEEDAWEDICGLPEGYAKELEDGIIEGKASYEDLKSGDKVIADQTLLYWYPELSVGSKFTVTVHDGDSDYEKELEIIAIGDYRGGLTNYNCLIMAKEAADALCSNNINRYFSIFADKEYDETLASALWALAEADGLFSMMPRKRVYDMNKNAFAMIDNACWIFLGILSVICIMNLVNTMLNSVNVRRKEFGMMQAIGMSNRQLRNMLLTEGLFYTVGTLMISLGAGSILGYGAFLFAKQEDLLRIREFQYPVAIAGVITVVLVIVQILLVLIIGMSIKKESLIDRIRFSE